MIHLKDDSCPDDHHTGGSMPRAYATGAALATVLVMSLTGCGSKNTVTTKAPASASLSPKADPGEVLAAAATKTGGTSLKVVLSDSTSDNLTGGYDASTKAASVAETTGTGLKVVVTPEDMYLSGTTEFQGQTLHLKTTKLRSQSPLAILADVVAPLTLLTYASGVRSTGATTFSGTLDFTKAHGTTAGTQKFIDLLVTSGGSRAASVGFTPATNAEGDLTPFKAPLPPVDPGKDSQYAPDPSDFGSPVAVAIPSGGTVVAAPESAYASM